MKSLKSKLLDIAKKIETKDKVTIEEIDLILGFNKKTESSKTAHVVRQFALPLSIAFGFLYTVFPRYFAHLEKSLPKWTNFSDQMLLGVDYLWNLLGDPVGKKNILYHIPNIALYAF